MPDQSSLEREHVSGLAFGHSKLVLARLAGRETLHVGKVTNDEKVPLCCVFEVHRIFELEKTVALLLAVVSTTEVIAFQELRAIDHDRLDECSHGRHHVVSLIRCVQKRKRSKRARGLGKRIL